MKIGSVSDFAARREVELTPWISFCAATYSGVPRNFVRGGFQQIQLRTENGDLGGGSPLVRGSGGSCNLVQ